MDTLPPYEWLRRSRTLLIDAYWPPLNPRLDFDAEELARVATDLHADAVRFGTVGKYGLVQNSIMPPHPELGGRDLLREVVDALKPRGVRVVAYVAVSHGLPRSLLMEQRPQWALRLDDGSLPPGVQHFGGEPLAPTCPFGSYRRDILAFIEQIVTRYAIDGLYLDGPYYDWNMGGPLDICQCDTCRDLHRAQTGQALPRNAEMTRREDPATAARLREFRNWVGDGLLALLRDIKTLCRPRDLPLIFNACASEARPPAHARAMLEVVDGFLLESDLNGLKGLGVGLYHDKVIWRYTQPHSAWPRLSTELREQENALAGWETVLWGGAPIISYAGRFQGMRDHIAPLREMFVFLEAQRDLICGTRPARYAGIVDMHGLERGTPKAQQSLEGCYLALQAESITCGVVPREALGNAEVLSTYPIMILPSSEGLTPAEIAALVAYAQNGGGLLVTGATPCQPGGEPLQTLLGIVPATDSAAQRQRRSALRYWDGDWDLYVQPGPELSREMAAGSPSLLPQQGALAVEVVADACVLAETMGGDDLTTPIGPAVVVRAAGQGRTAYINFPLERVYRQNREPGLSAMLAALVRRCAGREPPYVVHSRGLLWSALHTKPGVCLLHLLAPDLGHPDACVDVSLHLPACCLNVEVRVLGGREACRFERDADRVKVYRVPVRRHACLAISYEREKC